MLLTVTGIEFGEKISGKTGKPYTGWYLRGTNDKNEAKEYFVPEFKFRDEPGLEIVKTLQVGQQVTLNFTKNGANTSLTSIFLPGCNGSGFGFGNINQNVTMGAMAPGTPSPERAHAPAYSKPRSGFAGKFNKPDQQPSIERQSTLKNATDFYIAYFNRMGDDQRNSTSLEGHGENIKKLTNKMLELHAGAQ